MSTSPIALRKSLHCLKDPRINRCKRHLLIDIITMAVCAVVGGADTWIDIASFARHRKEWFARFLKLPNGIPSHHTFRRVFNRLDPLAFQQSMVQWLHQVSETLGFRHIAIDGKTLRHSADRRSPLRYLQLVSAWATEANLTLGQVAVDEESNEITAIPRLLELLDLQGALVTIDAMGCQKEIAQKVLERGGDYILAVKDNQEQLKNDIAESFTEVDKGKSKKVEYDSYETKEEGHGRQERRVYEVIYNPETIKEKGAWPKLRVIGRCSSERTIQGETSSEVRYFIGSRRLSAKRYGQVIRGHWGIENSLHWQLDVTFGEDSSRIQERNGGQNFALLRRLALGLLKQHPGEGSIRSKRYEASLDVSFLEDVLKK